MKILKSYYYYFFKFQLFIVFGLQAQKPNMQFTGVNFNNKLHDTKIWSFCEDKKGFLYFGGENGLYRYDSYSIINYSYSPSQLSGITNNRVFSLFLDKNQNFWVGTGGGLNLFDPENNQFFNYKNPGLNTCFKNTTGHVESIIQGKSDDIWFLDKDKGLGHLISKYKPIVYYNIHLPQYNMEYISCVQDINGIVWVGTNHGLLKLQPNSKNLEIVQLGDEEKLNIDKLFIKDSTLWIGTFEGLWSYSLLNNTFTYFDSGYNDSNKLSGKIVSGIIDYKDGLLLSIDGGGINYFDISKNMFYTYNSTNDAFLNCDNITSVYKDSYGSIWAGTYMNGINVCNTATMFSSLVRNKVFSSTERCVINGIAKSKNGDLWIVTDRSGVFVKSHESNSYSKVSIPNKTINIDNIAATDVKIINNEIWITTWGDGIVKIDKNHKIDVYNKGVLPYKLLSNKIRCLLYDSSNSNLWIGYFGAGVSRFNLKSNKIDVYRKTENNSTSLASDWINTIFQDSKGQIWVCTIDGLSRYNNQINNFDSYKFEYKKNIDLNTNNLSDIIQKDDSTLFIATNGSGIIKMSIDKPENYTFLVDFLKSNEQGVKSIIKDFEGNIWFCTQNSVNKFVEGNINKLIKYDVQNNVSAIAFNNSVKYMDPEGGLYFGTNNGFLLLNTHNYQPNNIPPPVVITKLTILFKKEQAQKIDPTYYYKNQKLLENEIRLEYNENDFKIEFAALNFINPSNNKYKYRLEGAEDTWHFEDLPTPATYYNLPSGNYSFKVYACNNHGVWNNSGAVLHIKIKAPWWKSYWLIFSFLILVITTLYFYIKSRIKLYQLQQLKLEDVVNDRTNELKSVNTNLETLLYRTSHDLHEPVKSLLGLVKVGNLEFPNDAKFSVFLSHLSNSANKLNKLVNELSIVSNSSFLSQKEKIDFSQIVDEIKTIISKENDDSTFEVTLEDSGNYAFYCDKKVIYTIIYNMIHNAFVYKKKTQTFSYLHIKISTKNDKLTLIFSDNGVGIEHADFNKIFEIFYRGSYSSKGSGMGLFVVKSLVTKLGGDIQLSSVKNLGAEFKIELPLS